jgi:pyrimidine operon attenuation protein/uracil phosphoribosyltransferase
MDIEEVLERSIERCESVAIDLTDLQFTMLRSMVREKSLSANSREKKIGRAKRSIDKAVILLKDALEDTGTSEDDDDEA